jgi:GntR family transcriptional regulator
MEFNENLPIYLQILDSIKKDIILGKIKAGNKLPSVREMAEEYGVNPNTMNRVYHELEHENITYTQRGIGTFITDDKVKIESIRQECAEILIKSFVSGMKGLGFDNKTINDALENFLNKEGQNGGCI